MALERILLAVGPGDEEWIERLVEEAIEIGKPAGATVVLGHVFTEEYEETLDTLSFDTVAKGVSPDEVADRHATVRELRRRLDAVGLDYEIHGAVGHDGESIVDLAGAEDADLVIVGARPPARPSSPALHRRSCSTPPVR